MTAPTEAVATVGSATPVTVQSWLAAARDALRRGSDTPRMDAEYILGAVLEVPRTRLPSRLDRLLDTDSVTTANDLLARRVAGEPIAYLLGEWEFWSLPLGVTPQVLIPRPETERLVERALTLAGENTKPCILDLGTGSGAIALALAHSLPQADVLATDCEAEAVAIARANAARLELNVRFCVGNWYAPLAPGARFNLIVSNPPYVARGDNALDPVVARFEPAVALHADHNGLAAFEAIIAGAPSFLSSGGHLVLEHGFQQAAAVCALLKQAGFCEVEDMDDLAGRPRVANACWPGGRPNA
ncbi:MAG: peptide chain release factor N(5)-glutamine methyltransferase [Sinobacteraceae bacterium]|nr:peptide chain release factor N(5)-glutamine methyltransferase [Nevskiaceae bacterium]